MKKILFTLDDYHVGGVTSFVKQYIHFLPAEYEAHVFGFKGNLDPAFFSVDVFIHELNENQKNGAFGRIRSLFSYVIALHRLCAKHSFDVVHLSIAWSSLAVFLVPRLIRTKKIITFYGVYSFEIGKGDPLIKNVLRDCIQFIGLLLSQKIITFSTYSKAILLTRFLVINPDKVIIIPGSVEIQSEFTKKTFSKKDQILKVINYGRAEERKGLLNLISAFKFVDRAELSLAFPMHSSYKSYIHKIFIQIKRDGISQKVHILHHLNNERKSKVIEDADLFVMPSLEYETFGMTMLECLAAGLPVIGNRNGGAIPEILTHIDDRLIFDSADPREIAKKIRWFQHLPNNEKQSLSEKCILVVRDHYQPRIISKMYQKCIGNE